MSDGVPRARGVERPHEHLVEPERVGPVGAADRVGRYSVLQALAHLAELPGDRPALEAVSAVALLDLLGVDVHPTLVGVSRREDVPLVVEALERLRRRDVAQVVEHLVPEARVQEVQHGVLDTAHVQIDEAGRSGAVAAGARSPVALDGAVDHRVLVRGVEVAQVVPARPGPLGHRVRLAAVRLRAVAQVELGEDPLLGACQRRLGKCFRVVGDPGLEVDDVGELDGEHLLGHGDRPVALVVHDREGLAPVALPAEEPVAQLVRDRRPALLGALEPLADHALRLGGAETVEAHRVVRRRHRLALADERLGPLRRWRPGRHLSVVEPLRRRLHDADDREIELGGELEVAVVVRGDGHDRPGSVAHEHVVGDEDRDSAAGGRVDCECAGEHA